MLKLMNIIIFVNVIVLNFLFGMVLGSDKFKIGC